MLIIDEKNLKIILSKSIDKYKQNINSRIDELLGLQNSLQEKSNRLSRD